VRINWKTKKAKRTAYVEKLGTWQKIFAFFPVRPNANLADPYDTSVKDELVWFEPVYRRCNLPKSDFRIWIAEGKKKYNPLRKTPHRTAFKYCTFEQFVEADFNGKK
jgi:hypothetical protein